jgi:hypothetical protein
MNAGLPLLLIVSGLVAACANTPTPKPSSTPSATPSVTIATPASTPPASETVVPALTVDHPMVTISPSTHLKDGQTVEVRVTGFAVGGKVWLSECASAAAATDLGCGEQLAAQPFLVTDDNRSGRATLVVRSSASAKALLAGPATTCVDQCVVVATLGIGYPYVIAPIAFERP